MKDHHVSPPVKIHALIKGVRYVSSVIQVNILVLSSSSLVLLEHLLILVNLIQLGPIVGVYLSGHNGSC